MDEIGKWCGSISAQSIKNISRRLYRDGLTAENFEIIWSAWRDESGCGKISDFAVALVNSIAFWALRCDTRCGEQPVPTPTLPASQALKLDEMPTKDAVVAILSVLRDLQPVLAAINLSASYAPARLMRAAASWQPA
ncbi:hypothetical protein GAY31_19250 [Azospirillum brasilense]|nr:hypothetical protein [Azospirillum brasilense]